MLATNAIPGYPTLLQIGDGGGPEAFTTIAEVTDLKPGAFKLDTADVTNMGSINAWEEVIPTIVRSGEVSFTINFIPTTATHSQSGGLLRDLKNRTKRNFKIIFSDATLTAWQFGGYVVKFEPEAGIDKQLKASVSIKITGQPTLAG